MRSSVVALTAFAAATTAHYTFPALFVNKNATANWEYVRETVNHYSNGPVTDVTSPLMACYELAGRPASDTYTIPAGSTVGFTVSGGSISHQGALSFYMARVPSGADIASWEPTGDVWFKIMELGPVAGPSGYTFPSEGMATPSTTIPSALPSGDYLIRIEHIALHTASTVGGAQFYLSCGQLRVTSGGKGTPGPLVSFPGAYKATDPGIQINIYQANPPAYVAPGPSVWTG